MKKALLLLIVACIVCTVRAQEETLYSHLSLGLKAGTSVMNSYGENSVLIKDRFNLVSGGSLEYTFNPLFGLGFDYIYLPYNYDYNPGKLTASANEFTLYASLNFTNLVHQYRSLQKLNVYANLGGGLSFYNYKNEDNAIPNNKGNDNTIVIPLGLNIEYNINNVFAISLGGEYRYHKATNMKGETRGAPNSNYFVLGALGVRYKILTNKVHVRDISYSDFQAAYSQNLNESKIRELQNQTNLLREKVLLREAEIEELQSALTETDIAVKNIDSRLNIDVSGIPSTEKRNAIQLTAIKQAQETVVKEAYDALAFETISSSIIKPSSYRTLDRLVEVLQKNPSWNLVLEGYTDNIGSLSRNVRLSEDRAESVKFYLETRGIHYSRITARGYGPENPIAPNDTPQGRAKNKRVEMRIE